MLTELEDHCGQKMQVASQYLHLSITVLLEIMSFIITILKMFALCKTAELRDQL